MTHDPIPSVELDARRAVEGADLDREVLDTAGRRLVEAFEQPGRPVWLPSPLVACVRPVLVPLLVWGRPGVGIHVVEEEPPAFDQWADVVAAATGAVIVPAHEAHLVAALGSLRGVDLVDLARSPAEHLVDGRRVVLRSSSLRPGGFDRPPDALGAPGVLIRLAGEPLLRSRSVNVEGIDPALILALEQLAGSSPGVDTWIAADTGVVVGIPRWACIEVVETWGGDAAA